MDDRGSEGFNVLMQPFSYQAIAHAAEILELCGLSDKETLKHRYLELCKRYHPDVSIQPNSHKFQEVQEAYQLLMNYVDHFKFRFDLKEFREQHPFFDEKEGNDWLYGI